MRFTRFPAAVLAVLLIITMCACALAESDYDQNKPELLTEDDLTAKACVVLDQATGAVLFSKNADRKLYPASTTKIMTCLLALEKCEPDDLVTIPQEVNYIPTDSSKTPVRAGEQMTMLDLLYGMMIKSGNDAAVAIAIHVSGSIGDFVDLMNEKARQIGCRNTNFVNPHGYHDANHVSTAYDMALIARAAMQNKIFRQIAAAKTHTMAATSYREKLRLETSINMYVATSKFYYPDLVGIKTGFHSKAGYCFIGAAEKDGVGLISAVMKTDENGRWRDTIKLMDYANTRYTKYTFAEVFDRADITASVQNADPSDEGHGLLKLEVVPGSPLDGYYIRVLPEKEDVTLSDLAKRISIDYSSDLQAPIQQGDILGTVSISGQSATAKVMAARSVRKGGKAFTFAVLFTDYGKYILIGLAGAAVIAVLCVKISKAVVKRRKKKEMLRRRNAAYKKYRENRR